MTCLTYLYLRLPHPKMRSTVPSDGTRSQNWPTPTEQGAYT